MNSFKAASNGVYVESLARPCFRRVVTRFFVNPEDIVDEQFGQLGMNCLFGVFWRRFGRERAESDAQVEQVERGQSI